MDAELNLLNHQFTQKSVMNFYRNGKALMSVSRS